MTGGTTSTGRKPLSFGASLGVEQLVALSAELQKLRCHPPLTKREDGKYEGDILGFVRGLRLSARLIYFLRERLSKTDLEVSWGHILDANEQSCSPECDVIVHTKGHVRRWNGSGAEQPVMEFKFIEASCVRSVVSCKSFLTSIDKAYPPALKKYGVDHVFLFAECCHESKWQRLRERAVKAGYRDVSCLYFTEKDESIIKTDETLYVSFGKSVLATVSK
jgi:hypothetical protein